MQITCRGSCGAERAVSFSQSEVRAGVQPHCGHQALTSPLGFNDLHVRMQPMLWSEHILQGWDVFLFDPLTSTRCCPRLELNATQKTS